MHFVAKFSRPFASYGTWQTEPTGANVFTQPTGDLGLGLPLRKHRRQHAHHRATTTSTGASAVSWQQTTAEANTWIQANPPALTQGDTYLASVTLAGHRRRVPRLLQRAEDVDSQPVNLTSTPTTVTIASTIPTGAIGAPVVQVRTAAEGAVDLEASALSLQSESIVETTGSSDVSTHTTPVQRVAAASNGKAASTVLQAPRGTEAKGGQSRTQVAAATGLGSGSWVTFDTTSQPTVTMKVAISYVSSADAAQNLRRRGPGLEHRRASPRAPTRSGTSLLDRIRIGGGTYRRSRLSSTPRCTTRCSTRACSPTPTATTSASTTRCTARSRARRSTPTTPAGTSTAPRCRCWR